MAYFGNTSTDWKGPGPAPIYGGGGGTDDPQYGISDEFKDVPMLGPLTSLSDPTNFAPPRINERPEQYNPNAGSFNLTLPTDVGTWQQGLSDQATGYGAQQQGAYQQAANADTVFGSLTGQGAQDYSRGVGAYEQGQQGLGLMQSAALGQQPSVAQIQQQQGLQQAMMTQRSAAASGPYNPAAGLLAQQNMANIQAAGVNQQAALRANEMATARGQYGQMLGQQQGAAQNLGAMTQGQQGQVLNYGQQQRGYALGLGQSQLAAQQEVRNVGQAQQQGQIAYEQEKGQQQLGVMNTNESRLEANQKATQDSRSGGMGMLGAGVGALSMLSDEQSKQQLQSAQQEISSLRQQLATASMSTGSKATAGSGDTAGNMMAGMQLGKMFAGGGGGGLLSDERAKKLDNENAQLRSALYSQASSGGGAGANFMAGIQAGRALFGSVGPSKTEEVAGTTRAGRGGSAEITTRPYSEYQYIAPESNLGRTIREQRGASPYRLKRIRGYGSGLEEPAAPPPPAVAPPPAPMTRDQRVAAFNAPPVSRDERYAAYSPGAPPVAGYDYATPALDQYAAETDTWGRPQPRGLLSDARAKQEAFDAGYYRALTGSNQGPADELARVPALTYRYRPEARAAFPDETAPGQRYGVTAQDLERAGPVGRSLVQEGPGGYKQIDTPQAVGTLLAAVGQQQRELDQLKRQPPAVASNDLVGPGWDDYVRQQLARGR